jgi:hypothetical protein
VTELSRESPDLPRRNRREPQYIHLSEDRHQQALYRLAAVGQYLYDTMNGDADSDRDTPDPLPLLAMEQVREVQRLIDLAIKHGQITRRRCLGGDLELIERLPPKRGVKYRVDLGRTIVTWLPGRCRVGRRVHAMGHFDMGLGIGVLIVMRRNPGVSSWRVERKQR